jgi:hypothetical protein
MRWAFVLRRSSHVRYGAAAGLDPGFGRSFCFRRQEVAIFWFSKATWVPGSKARAKQIKRSTRCSRKAESTLQRSRSSTASLLALPLLPLPPCCHWPAREQGTANSEQLCAVRCAPSPSLPRPPPPPPCCSLMSAVCCASLISDLCSGLLYLCSWSLVPGRSQ